MVERTMKDSGIEWIGAIPSEWNVCKVKNVANLYTGNSIKDELKSNYEDPINAHPYISSKDIDADLQTIDYNNGMYVKDTDDSFEIAKEGDTLMCIEGGSAGRKKAILNQKVSFVNKLCCFSPNNIEAKYLYYYLMSPGFEKEFNKYINGLIGGVSVSILKNFWIQQPSRDEQVRIARFLDKKVSEINLVISKTKESIKEYKKLKQSIITEAVTKGLDPSAEMKDSGNKFVGVIPKHWDIKRTRFIADSLEKGSGITKEEVYPDGDIPCVRYGEIYTKYNGGFSICVSRTKLEQIIKPSFFTFGDLLFCGTGELVEEIGKNIVYLGHEKCLAGGDIIIMKHKQDPVFINYALNSGYSQTQKSYGKAKLKVVHISASEIGNVWIALPPIKEQKAIGEYLDEECFSLNNLISKKEQVITELEQYKKSLIYEYVTGKKEVA